MSDQLKYDFAQMFALADEIRADRGALSETHDELKGYVNGLVSSWEGDAQAEYAQVQARWDSNNTEILDVLDQIARAVQQGAEEMMAREQAAKASFNG